MVLRLIEKSQRLVCSSEYKKKKNTCLLEFYPILSQIDFFSNDFNVHIDNHVIKAYLGINVVFFFLQIY